MLMSVKTVLFDLDGSLLPMDQEVFSKAYFKGLAGALMPHGYDPQEVINGVLSGVAAMVKNDGTRTNEEAFWESFARKLGRQVRQEVTTLDRFYAEEFGKISAVCGYDGAAGEVVKKLKERGIRLVLATNPIFPRTATLQRIAWAGLDADDFELITTYEDAGFCKPNAEYYRDIVNRLGLDPTECVMAGNDVGEDMVAKTLGMETFLLTPCLINRENEDISQYPNGDLAAFWDYISEKI